jgi:hypothetical protein
MVSPDLTLLKSRHAYCILACRLSITAIAVASCYLFQWQCLRYLTSELNRQLVAMAGIYLERVSADTVIWNGVYYQYGNACIFADVWCGSLPLLWDVRVSVLANIQILAPFTLGLFVFNIIRLSLSDILCQMGVPWFVGHNVLGGVAYFLVWKWIWNNVSWRHRTESFDVSRRGKQDDNQGLLGDNA